MLGFHDKALLQFSGGKDSTALLYKARPWLDRITVLFADTGATFPHVLEHVTETCKALGAKLEIVRPPLDIDTYHSLAGLPSDIVPVEATDDMSPYMKVEQKVQSYLRCCNAMLWAPMAQAVKQSEATLVLRGSKKADARVGIGRHTVENGVEYDSPLWDMTDDDVLAYLAAEGVILPKHYEFIKDSLDCWSCTAHLAHHGAAKMKFIQAHYPELWPDVKGRLTTVRDVVDRERNKIASALEVANA